jgi:type IV secretion system protein VirB10
MSAYGHSDLPDLDAAAPMLVAHDGQRLNRKALVFLAGLLLLLVAAAMWMLHGATGPDAQAAVRKEAVVIPPLPPASGPVTASAPPIAVVPLTDDPPATPPIPLASAEPTPMPASAPVPGPRPPTLLERRMGAPTTPPGAGNPYAQALLAGLPAPPGQPAPATAVAVDVHSGARFIEHPDALLVRGTYIRCVLETRIVTDIPGFTSCVVAEPTYSINGRNLLLPRGSKISGRYDTDANGPRIAVIWDRITTPNGFDVSMASPGVDNLGGAGHPGDYDAHWGSRVSAALMISLVSDVFKYEGERHGPRTTTVSNGLVTQAPFESNTARTLERLANQALDRSISRPATVTINQGTLLNVYVARDVDFSSVLPPP